MQSPCKHVSDSLASAERARSISPQKSSPANTPSPRSSRQYSQSTSTRLTEPPQKLDSPATTARAEPTETQSERIREDSAGLEGDSDASMLSSPTKENESPDDVKRTPPARSGTLSWQRRPQSRGNTRPLSMLAAQNATQRSLGVSQDKEPSSAGATETTFSRDQIAQNLGAKDPSWFRQTSDRGLGSAAFRKNQVEDEERSDVASGRAQLPGMSDASRDRSPSAASASTSISGRGGLASPLPLDSASRFEPPTEEPPPSEELHGSPTGRLSPSRSTSPTKGMGGFVQSAMLKRSDSVKRWSVQTPGLSRADTVTSHRGSVYGRERPTSISSREPTRSPASSRPTSRHGNTSGDATPRASQAGSPTESEHNKEDAALPVSPSKTMDSRRWSPTKSSWLDSALNKPESPKPQLKPFQTPEPSWKAQLNKNKAEKTGSESSRGPSASHKHQVSIGGLMRSSPMGAGVKSNTTDLGGIYSPPARGNRPSMGHRPSPSFSRSTTDPSEDREPIEASDAPTQPKEEDLAEETAKRTSVASPSAVKPKPETPPRKDFRSTLKARPADSGAEQKAEPEFKNALGNLRRTKTQNYVAPDELKDNIMRGKSALNTTGGPQKSIIKDEFKDAILKKKGDFRKAQEEGKGVTRTQTSAADKPVPEGLARRAELGKPVGFKRDVEPVSQALPKKAESPKPSPAPKRVTSQSSADARSPSASTNNPPVAAKPTRVSTEPDVSSSPSPRPLPSLQKETSAPSRLGQGSAPGGKLAGRFNPALAGILARGPPAMATEGGRSPGASSPASPAVDEPAKPGPQLTHMTKGRARGPRRKAPTTVATSQPASSPVKEDLKPEPKPTEAVARASPVPSPKPAVRSPPPEAVAPLKIEKANGTTNVTDDQPETLSIQRQVANRAASRDSPAPLQIGSNVRDRESGSAARPLPLRRQPTSPEKPTAEPLSPIKPHKTGGDVSQPGSPKKLDVKRMSKFLDDSNVGGPKSDTPKEPVKLFHQRTGSRSPMKKDIAPEMEAPSPTKVDSEPVASVADSMSRYGGAAKSPSPPSKPSFDRDSLPSMSKPSTPKPLGARALPSTPSRSPVKSTAVDSPAPSPRKQGSELSNLLTDFFGSDRPKSELKVDPAELLAARPGDGVKITTLGMQMFQISGDGKKLPILAGNERTLFEQEMYVCIHEFENEMRRKQLAVYFWVGDEVSEPTAEDAQLFAQREARSLGTRLIKLSQGKETSEFLQALGGTVISRRGSSNKYDSLAPNMLCGRRHLNQVVFDEVDFTAANLCAGFPYLINSSGKCYLWKGKGSNVDELSCAKLIAMELSLTGEIVEFEEGGEPDSFWDLFESKAKPHSADHWRLKPNFGKYGSRLFCSDADSRQQVRSMPSS